MKILKKVKNMNLESARTFFNFLHMPSFGVSIPDTDAGRALLKRIQEQADAYHDKKASAYARAAIERDLNAGPVSASGLGADIMTELARRLLGEPLAEDMAIATSGLDQRRELRLVLQRYIDAKSILATTPTPAPGKASDLALVQEMQTRAHVALQKRKANR